MMGSVSQLGYFQRRQGAPINRFPKIPLMTAGFLILFAIGATMFGQVTGIGTVKTPSGTPAAVRDLVILQKDNGEISVSDAGSGELLASYSQTEGGFVRGSLRAFNRMRLVAGVPQNQTYRLIAWTGGAVSLSDTGTGERFYLDAFGRDNAAAFAEFLNNHGGGKE
jgi:putative photosynthetic complex assembly protein